MKAAAQLADRSLSYSEIHSSNTVMCNFKNVVLCFEQGKGKNELKLGKKWRTK